MASFARSSALRYVDPFTHSAFAAALTDGLALMHARASERPRSAVLQLERKAHQSYAKWRRETGWTATR